MSLPQALRQQAAACRDLQSPFMGQLLTTLAETWRDDSPLGTFCAKFEGDIGPRGASLPLRLAGALHALVLSGRAPELRTVYPPNVVDDATLIAVVLMAIDAHQGFVLDWMQSPPQTNEVRRSAALIAAAHWIAARHDLPFVTSELGASGGLNLMWDQFALQTNTQRLGPDDAALTLTPDWSGPSPAAQSLRVIDRRGVDLNPLDPRNPNDALRLLAYLWADQPDRADLTRKAIAAQNAPVDRGDAIDWLVPRLTSPRIGQTHLIYHTIAWQYFPKDVQERGTDLIEAAGRRATNDAPLAWLRMEADSASPGAALTLRLWPGDDRIDLGRVDFHGRWIQWIAD